LLGVEISIFRNIHHPTTCRPNKINCIWYIVYVHTSARSVFCFFEFASTKILTPAQSKQYALALSKKMYLKLFQ
jgi:hypothetical protein